MRAKWCRVQVLRNGRSDWPFENARVAGKVSGFVGGMTEDFRTDDRGIAIVEWYGGDYLEKLYISGKTFEGRFEEGQSYSIPY